LLVGRAAGVPVSAILLRLAVVQPFVLSVALLALFQGRGLTVFAAIALKTTTCVAALQLLSHTTPVSDILRAMTTSALGLLDRFLHVLLEESRRMRRARAARTWRRGRWVAWRFLASVVAVSFIRSMARAERVAVAMRARGWS
jgi:cobalt/nickel transport system permease protein